MSMSEKDFKEIEAAVDRLFDSELTKTQKEDATTIMRIAYRHVHKSNDQVFKSQQLADRAMASFKRLEFIHAPVTESIQ